MVNLSWETGSLHSDKEYMKTTPFGERILGGPCIIPFVAGLSSHPLHTAWERSGIQVFALMGIENVRFTAPLHPGDTMRVETEVTEFRPTAKPGRFLFRLRDIAYKQDGRAIMEMERVLLAQKG